MAKTNPHAIQERVAQLRQRFARASRRLEDDTPYSPAWAATKAWVEDLEAELVEAEREPAARSGALSA